MKILILSNNPLSHTSNNGKTIASIVSVLRENEFAQIHFSRESVEADFSLIECGISDERYCDCSPINCFLRDVSQKNVFRIANKPYSDFLAKQFARVPSIDEKYYGFSFRT